MKFNLLCFALALTACSAMAQRTETLLRNNWLFTQTDSDAYSDSACNTSGWQSVQVPHDWAIYGPFDRRHDLQKVAVKQNGETVATLKTGRTGGLPYIGTGWYRTQFSVAPGQNATLLFDGAMSEAQVWVNGHKAVEWPYGYNSFHVDVTPYINRDGSPNTIAVRLENKPFSSRWYPGAGLYRNVHLIQTSPLHIPVWGTHITTPHIEPDFASVRIDTRIDGADKQTVVVTTDIYDPSGNAVASGRRELKKFAGTETTQNIEVPHPTLWSPENPALYKAVTTLADSNGNVLDTYSTTFGIRSIEVIPNRGFYLNGQKRKFKGVCNHHDLGPLGTAVNTSALRHQLQLLKDMGCDALRTAHNMPAPELVALCDSMGIMMMLEPFDEWDIAKCENGYHRFFNQWAERDMVNMLHHYRNSASVVMWSVGNEVPTQCSPKGFKVASRLQEICHREDPTRPVTCGMDQVSCVLGNGFAAIFDVPGLNYRAHRYVEAYNALPQGVVLGSETSSTVSSRGTYKLPMAIKSDAMYADHQSSGYDTEHCSWSNIPDKDFALADDYPWTMGQFVWTGFDYLGEPSPYDTDAWPSHSSLFGIIDLASIPKDRYYLYRSLWNQNAHTLHILPHWTWPGREGLRTPVMAYTDWPEAELFVNGVSHGRQRRLTQQQAAQSTDSLALMRRFRLIWPDVTYTPGRIDVVAYDANGTAVDTATVHTAGRPHHIKLSSSRPALAATADDLAYITASVVDRDGNLCPDQSRLLKFKVTGAGSYRASANGDAACIRPFHLPEMETFAGQLTVIVQSASKPGTLKLQVSAPGLKSGIIEIPVK